MTTLQIGNKQGFSYIEVMLAVLIFALGYIVVIGAFSRVVEALNTSKDNIQAVVLLNEKIAHVQEDFIKEGELKPQNKVGTFPGELNRFQWALDVHSKGDTPDINQVRLEVSWGGFLRKGRIVATTFMERKLNEPGLPR